MLIGRVFIALCIALLLQSCASTVDQYASTGIERIQSVHDKQFALSMVGLCGSPLRSIMEGVGNDPDELRSILILCGYAKQIENAVEVSE